jgi:hypothetical protein
MARRVGSESAAKVRSSAVFLYLTIWLTLGERARAVKRRFAASRIRAAEPLREELRRPPIDGGKA